MIKSLPARTSIFLAILAALVIGTFALKGVSPAQAEGDPETVKYGTTDQLTPEEEELLQSDIPKTAVVDTKTGDITSVTPDTAG